MKRLFLSALAMAFAIAAAQAQRMGVTISPVGAGPGDQITITVFPEQTCPLAPDAKSLATAPGPIRFHSGITTAAGTWRNKVSADPNEANSPGTPVVSLLPQPNGIWIKTIRATDYYGAPVASIMGINFTFNGGDEFSGSVWDNEGKDQDLTGTNPCADFYAPFPIDGSFVSIKKVRNNGVFTVSQNAPNPVSGATTIRFFLNRPEHVSIRVTNILGETIKTLQNGKMLAGQQALTWNAYGAAPGVYFYTIEAGSAIETRKMLVK